MKLPLKEKKRKSMLVPKEGNTIRGERRRRRGVRRKFGPEGSRTKAEKGCAD